MGTRTSYTPGTFCWVDLSTSDREAAKRFYAELLGWEYDDREGEAGIYSMAQVGGADVAAIVGQMPAEAERGVRSHFNNYICTDDADATLARARELGANVLGGAFDVEGAGLIGAMIDPVGAHCFLWQPKEHFGAGRVNEPGCLTWNELGTADPQRALDFYTALFGWATQEIDTGDAPGYTIVRVGERSNGGVREHSEAERDGGAPSAWMPYFVVESLSDAIGLATSLGGASLVGPMRLAAGEIAVLSDPQGAVFALWEGPTDD